MNNAITSIMPPLSVAVQFSLLSLSKTRRTDGADDNKEHNDTDRHMRESTAAAADDQ